MCWDLAMQAPADKGPWSLSSAPFDLCVRARNPLSPRKCGITGLPTLPADDVRNAADRSCPASTCATKGSGPSGYKRDPWKW